MVLIYLQFLCRCSHTIHAAALLLCFNRDGPKCGKEVRNQIQLKFPAITRSRREDKAIIQIKEKRWNWKTQINCFWWSFRNAENVLTCWWIPTWIMPLCHPPKLWHVFRACFHWIMIIHSLPTHTSCVSILFLQNRYKNDKSKWIKLDFCRTRWWSNALLS